MIDNTGTTVAEETPDTAQQPTRADAWTGIFFIIFGLLITFESWRMPRMEEFGSSIWSAPGVVPGMIGLSLTTMLFDREDRRVEGKALSGRALAKRAALAFVISAVAAWSITTVFEDVFYVRLP